MNPATLHRLDGFRRTLLISGGDAPLFLQGQLSGDVRLLDSSRWRFTSYNSPKGRMLACMSAWRGPLGFHLELPAVLAETVAKRLRTFVLRSKVSIEQSPEAAIALSGSGARCLLELAGLDWPETAFEQSSSGGLTVLRRLPADLVSLHGPGDALEALAGRWSAETVEGSAATWARLEVESGVPQVFPETQDRFVPQMANLDRLGGIGFDKGCYTGQEIVARLHYLGQIKRRMFRCEGSGPVPAAGAPVHRHEDPAQAVGDVVQAAESGAGRFVASIVLQLSSASADDLFSGHSTLAAPQAYRYPGEPPA